MPARRFTPATLLILHPAMRNQSPALRLALPLAVVAALSAVTRASLAAPTPAPAAPAPADAVDEQAEFEKGRNAYRAQKYDEAERRFLDMLDPDKGSLHDKVLKKQARMYWAATELALQRASEAVAQFDIILEEDRDYEPDPLAFSTQVVNAFIDARAQLREKLEASTRENYRRAAERRANAEALRLREAERMKTLERLAREVEVTQKHSRWIALLPLGVGQFQNGQRGAGWFFLVSESAFVATGLATLPFYYIDLSNAHDVLTVANRPTAQAYLDRANIVRYVNLAAYGALALTTVVGAIQAEVAYVPDVVKTEPRAFPVPQSPPVPGGGAAPAPSPAGAVRLPFSLGAFPLPSRDSRGVGGGGVRLGVSF